MEGEGGVGGLLRLRDEDGKGRERREEGMRGRRREWRTLTNKKSFPRF